MSTLAYRIASLAVAAAAVAGGFILLPAAQTHRNLSKDRDDVALMDVVQRQFQLQRDALGAGVRLAVRDTADWRVDPDFLAQLTTAEPGAGVLLEVNCSEGARTVQLAKTRRVVGRGVVTRASDIYAEALKGTLRSGWLLTERDGRKAFYGVRSLSSDGWSIQDAEPAEDATVSLWKTFPDMALACSKQPAAEGSLNEALSMAGPGTISPATFAPGGPQPPKGLQVLSEYFDKLGAVQVRTDSTSTTVQFSYDYREDVAKAGATFLRARETLAAKFVQQAHLFQRLGLGNETTSNRYLLDHGGQLTLELAKTPDSGWRVNFSITLPLAEAAKLVPADTPEQPVAEPASAQDATPVAPPTSAAAVAKPV